MSHQSGITGNDLLRGKFAEMKDGHIRVVVVLIENETLVIKEEQNVEGTFNEDFDKMIPSLVEQNRPAFYFIRLDTVNETNGYNWLLINYIPDSAKVREKMLYASTVATLKREFGLMYITEEIRATSIDEMTVQSFDKHIRSRAAPPPMSIREEEDAENKQKEMNTNISVTTRQNTLHGLMFPLDEKAIEILDSFKEQNVDYVQLEIDDEKELIILSHSESNITPEGIQKVLPTNAGRYHIYRFKHEFNDETVNSLVFLYSVPGHGQKIKLRTVYASCKGSVIDTIEKQYGIKFDQKLELCDITDLTTDFLSGELHPQAPAESAAKTPFTKPKPGPARGPRRLVKTADTSNE